MAPDLIFTQIQQLLPRHSTLKQQEQLVFNMLTARLQQVNPQMFAQLAPQLMQLRRMAQHQKQQRAPSNKPPKEPKQPKAKK